MRKILLILFLLLFFNGFSQNSKIVIFLKDAETNLPIEDATVFISKSNQTLLSNAEGAVSFVLKGVSNIRITHPEYAVMTIRSVALKSNENTVFLKRNVTDLDEIIITKTHPQKILKELVRNSTKSLTMKARLKIYVREFCKLNGEYASYNDGLLDFLILGKGRDFKNHILVEQNRSFGFVTEEVGSGVLGYNLNDIMENYHDFKYLNPILESSAKNRYNFLIKLYNKNNDYYLMTISPQEELKGLYDDFTVIYDWRNKIIIEVSSYISPATLANMEEKTSVGSKNVYKSFFKMMYRFDGFNYYLLGSKEEIGFERIEKGHLKTNVEVRNYFVTTNFSQQKLSYKENQVFKEKTLYNKKNYILTDYWNVSGLTATQEEQKIIDEIEFRE